MNRLIEAGNIRTNTVIKLKNYTLKEVSNDDKTITKKLLLISDFKILSHESDRIGTPKSVDESLKGYSSHSRNPYGPKVVMERMTPSTPQMKTNDECTAISNISMYNNSKWNIRAKVMTKSSIKKWENAKSSGRMFSAVIQDSYGSTIKCTFFTDAVFKFFDQIKVGTTYIFSHGKAKVADPRYNNATSAFEIQFDKNSIIVPDQEGPMIIDHFDFTKIGDLESSRENDSYDVIAIVKSVGDKETIQTKSGKDALKCVLVLCDDSLAEIRCTIWGETVLLAHEKFSNHPVIAVRQSKLNSYGGRSLSGGDVIIEPNVPERDALFNWWRSHEETSFSNLTLKSLTFDPKRPSPATFQERTDEFNLNDLNDQGQPNSSKFMTFHGSVNAIVKTLTGEDGSWYTACPNANPPCKNLYKVTKDPNGKWYCDKCHGSYPSCVRKYLIQASLTTDSKSFWVAMYNDNAEKLFGGITADQLHKNIMETGASTWYESVVASSYWTEWIFTCKVTKEVVGDEERAKINVVEMEPVDFQSEINNILDSLK